MILIAHRGNINGKLPDKENHPDYIMEAVKQGYEVEIDAWVANDKYYLGHDAPQYEVELDWFFKPYFWCHAKNLEMAHIFSKVGPFVHYFYHENDACTLTSKEWIWTYPGQPILSDSAVAVLPEKIGPQYDISRAGAICSDFIHLYKNRTIL